jgi:hypothetical protein
MFLKRVFMYTVEIELGWDEIITIKTDDFNKVAMLQAFIAEQEECGWAEEVEEDIELMSFTDSDGVTWYYDEDEDEWLELEEDEEEDEDQE